MSVHICKVFQTITLTHPTNFALVKNTLNQLPGGPDGPDPQGPVLVTQLQPDVRGHLDSVPDNYSNPPH